MIKACYFNRYQILIKHIEVREKKCSKRLVIWFEFKNFSQLKNDFIIYLSFKQFNLKVLTVFTHSEWLFLSN